MQNNQPIGIFDSGVGGLSITRAIHQLLPNESFIYLADSLYAPYGNLTPKQITERVNKIAQWFINKNVKALVIACNTATVNAIEQLRLNIKIPIIGVEPAIKPAVAQSKSNNVAIMVTQATANNDRFINLVNRYKQGAEVYIQACPGLVEIVENDNIDSKHCQDLLRQYLTPMLNPAHQTKTTIDTVVLGCTHYPFLREKIISLLGDNVTLIETSMPVAKQLERQLLMRQLNAVKGHIATFKFYSSSATKQQEKVFSLLWRKSITLRNITI
ncbi:glutamate racemase [Thalassotalea profundi]|uniref:glutamate racemase n=1 Tax=Thalassotalea profundi TaxID=2036687 RepID=UPI001E345C66|nr:glutamate racemase [Thalassotalea profundi]